MRRRTVAETKKVELGPRRTRAEGRGARTRERGVIKTFLFDLGNVLMFFSHERMTVQLAEELGRTKEETWSLLFGSELQQDFERGRMTTQEFHERIEREVGRNLEREALERAVADIFWPNEPMRPLVQRLKSEGYRLVLLSNTSEPHVRFIRQQFDVLDDFDELVLSYEVGAAKPEPAIYQAALRAAQAAPNECFYTDDISKYVAAGRAHGIEAHLFEGYDGLVERLRSLGVRGV